ncbi:hypothetical protein [Vibrio alfacsensis]|uniref:hypothetical protein n=1 Tax=Vibrio alfacsensis TaxID=1074311 RepID=UPI004067EF8F
MSSSKLVALGRVVPSGDESFAAFSGSMLLAVVGLESFLNSFGFLVSQKDESFQFDDYEQKRVEEKIDLLIKLYDLDLSKGKRPYQTIKTAITWRNSIAHSKPTYTEGTNIQSPHQVFEVKLCHPSNHKKYTPYEQMVSEKNANLFNLDIVSFITFIEAETGIKPRARSTYQISTLPS